VESVGSGAVAQPPTIRDISAATGLSTYSVSQALAGKPGVGEATRSRVLTVAAELGYVRNNLAANLQGSTSRTVGVLTASGRNQYYALLVQAVDAILQRDGFHAVSNDAMRAGTYSAETERLGVEELLQQRVAAVVATYSLAPESLALLTRWHVPVVFADSLPPLGAESYPFVGVDNFAASAEVAAYLADLGHRDSVVLAYPREWSTRAPRQQGFSETARQRGMRVRVLEAENSAESAEHTIDALLHSPRSTWPTAIYAINTVLLQGTLKALRRARITIPQTVSVVGFDDFEWADLIQPPITVVDQHIDEIGAAAGRTVLQLIHRRAARGDDSDVPHVLLPTDLVIRDSCASPRASEPV